jgi:ubiquinone/menaquinone biosynthesis C-methylase UbiE
MDPKTDDRILDVGFGGGYSLLELAGRVPAGRINGVDYSQAMVDRAKGLVRERRLESLVRVRQGDVAKLPFRARTFDKVLTVNSIYYWPDIAGGFRETSRVLKTGGRIAVGFRSGMSLRPFTWTWERFWLYEPDQMADILRGVGFRIVQVEHSDRWRIPDMVVVVGEKQERQ